MHKIAHKLCLIVVSAFVSCLITGWKTNIHAQQESAIVSEERARGINQYKQGDMMGAINTLSAVVKENKNDADAWRYLGLALKSNSELKGARKAFQMAIQLRPEDALAHTGLAYVLLLSDKTADAMREAQRALESDPQNAEAHYIMGVAKARKGEYSSSLEEAETSIKIDPNYAPAFLLKSQALVNVYLRENVLAARKVARKSL